jgi:hypothetical protein
MGMNWLGREKIHYKDLPPRLKYCVDSILRHRSEIHTRALGAGAVGGAAIAFAFILHPVVGAATTAFTAVSAYGFHRMHDPTFRKEYESLFSTLKKYRDDSKVKSLIESKNTRYIVVPWNGNIDTRRFAPRIFGEPVGRRRIENPLEHFEKKFRHLRNLPAERERGKLPFKKRVIEVWKRVFRRVA